MGCQIKGGRMNKISNFIAKVGDNIFELIQDKKLTASSAELRRLFDHGGIRINDTVIRDKAQTFMASDFTDDRCILKIGCNQEYNIHRLYENYALGR